MNNKGFTSEGVTRRLETLRIYSSSELVYSFVLRTTPEHKACSHELNGSAGTTILIKNEKYGTTN
jgi:hypothetical protein